MGWTFNSSKLSILEVGTPCCHSQAKVTVLQLHGCRALGRGCMLEIPEREILQWFV